MCHIGLILVVHTETMIVLYWGINEFPLFLAFSPFPLFLFGGHRVSPPFGYKCQWNLESSPLFFPLPPPLRGPHPPKIFLVDPIIPAAAIYSGEIIKCYSGTVLVLSHW